jgi:hypothetical protein
MPIGPPRCHAVLPVPFNGPLHFFSPLSVSIITDDHSQLQIADNDICLVAGDLSLWDNSTCSPNCACSHLSQDAPICFWAG